MKKNQKGFRQEKKNLEKVSGGAMSGIETKVIAGDISIGYSKTENHETKNSHNIDSSKKIDVSSIQVTGNVTF